MSSSIQAKLDELVATIETDIRNRLSQVLGINVAKTSTNRKPRTATPPRVPSVSNGKRARRTEAETDAMAKRVSAFVSANPKGVRVDAIGQQFGLTTKQLMLPIAKALKAKMIGRKGARRATTYLPPKK